MPATDTTFWENFGLHLLEFAIAGWFFVLGSIIGSLLNVVAYRLPLGKNLWWPPSSCPNCDTRIQPRDNVPILGWFLLGGKCRACKAEISSRYPIVEAITGLIFLIIANVELFSGGANLPFRTPDTWTGTIWTVLYFSSDILALYFFHVLLMSAVFVVVLIDWDGKAVPARPLLTWLALIALGLVMIKPTLIPVPLAKGLGPPTIVTAALQSIAGLALGSMIGYFGWRKSGLAPAAVLGLCGSFMGWQSAAGIALLGLVLSILGRISQLERMRYGVAVGISAFIYLIIWQLWMRQTWLPSYETLGIAWLVWTAVFVIIAWNDIFEEKLKSPSAWEIRHVEKGERSANDESTSPKLG